MLAVVSLAALTIVLLKLWQFAALRLEQRAPVEAALAAWSRRDPQAALAALVGSPNPVAGVLAAGLRGLERPVVDRALLREELARLAALRLECLGRYLRTLESLAALSPLLGLLGTVLGWGSARSSVDRPGACGGGFLSGAQGDADPDPADRRGIGGPRHGGTAGHGHRPCVCLIRPGHGGRRSDSRPRSTWSSDRSCSSCSPRGSSPTAA